MHTLTFFSITVFFSTNFCFLNKFFIFLNCSIKYVLLPYLLFIVSEFGDCYLH
jgi:hypothetical protein